MKNIIGLFIATLLFCSFLAPVSADDVSDTAPFLLLKDTADNGSVYMEIDPFVDDGDEGTLNFTLLPIQDSIVGWVCFTNETNDYTDLFQMYTENDFLKLKYYSNESDVEVGEIVNITDTTNVTATATTNLGALEDVNDIIVKYNETGYFKITLGTLSYTRTTSQIDTITNITIYLGTPRIGISNDFNCYNGYDNINLTKTDGLLTYDLNFTDYVDTTNLTYDFEDGDNITVDTNETLVFHIEDPATAIATSILPSVTTGGIILSTEQWALIIALGVVAIGVIVLVWTRK